MPADGKYIRVYYAVLDDPKFAHIYDDDSALASWLRLLLTADAMWPSPADLPRWVKPKVLALLTGAGLVDLEIGQRFRVHGLDAERSARSIAARNAADVRWHRNGTAAGNPAGNAEVMPSRERVLEEGEPNKGIQGVVVTSGARPARRRVDPR